MYRLTFLSLLLAGCNKAPPYQGAFNVPSAIAVSSAPAQTVFQEPIAFVASRHGGQISVLATKQGRFVTDDATASFVRGNPLPAGQSRLLTSISAVATGDRITVFAVDAWRNVVLQIPYIVGKDASGPVKQGVEVSDVISSGAATLQDLEVKEGFTSTEEWTLLFDRGEWYVTGSRSGRMHQTAIPGEPYTGVDRVVAFTVQGDAVDGDTITFSTDSGLVEHDLGFLPTSISTTPDQSSLVVVGNDVDGAPRVAWLDPQTGATTAEAQLPQGARPGRLDWAADRLYIADNALPNVWSLEAGATEVTTYDLPWPVLDVAPIDREGLRRIYVVPMSGTQVYALDIDDNTLVDLNPWSSETSGMKLFTPVRGIAPLPNEVRFVGDDDEGERKRGHAVAISLHSGSIVYMDQDTGCLLANRLGPRALNSNQFSNGDYFTKFGGGTDGPYLATNFSNANHLVVNGCGGVAPSEDWTLTFRQELQAWEVEGATSGLMQTLAYEEVRYGSDGGEVSFLIRSGATPAQEGYTIHFRVEDGIVRSSGDRDGSGDIDRRSGEYRISMPADPVPLSYPIGPVTDGWDSREIRSYVLVPAEGSDLVVRVGPETGLVEALWR